MINISSSLQSSLRSILTKREDQYISELKQLFKEYHSHVKWVEGFENKYSLGDLVYVTWKSQYSIASTYEAIKDVEILNYRFQNILAKNRYSVSNIRDQILTLFKEYIDAFESLAIFYKYSLDICDEISLDKNWEVSILWNSSSQKFQSLKSKVDNSLREVTHLEESYYKILNEYYKERGII